MYGCENWIIKKAECWKIWCFQTMMLEKILENSLDCKDIKPVTPKGNQPWIFIGRTDAEAEAPILWPPDEKTWLTGKDPDAGERLRAGREGDDRGWRWLDGITDSKEVSLSKLLGDSGQGSLACCSPWGHKVWHDSVTDQLRKGLEVVKVLAVVMAPMTTGEKRVGTV